MEMVPAAVDVECQSERGVHQSETDHMYDGIENGHEESQCK